MTHLLPCCFPLDSKYRARCLVLLLALVLPVFYAPRAQAQKETVIYSFSGNPDGQFPSGFVRDGMGNLYGTAEYGGAYNNGAVFEISGRRRKILYSFTGKADGGFPGALLRDPAGNLYGVTSNGGDLACPGGKGCGTVFKLDTGGKETVLHSFAWSTTDGGNPLSLIEDRKGNLYGVTELGGPVNAGTVFKIDAGGNYSVLYSFSGGSIGGTDGAAPNGVISDGRGNLFGTTFGGGPVNFGTVFKVDNTGKETVLFTFSTKATGRYPDCGLALDPAGNLYGTTEYGGTEDSGTIFKLSPSGQETILHSFASPTDGGLPQSTLTRDAAGSLYGSTALGGVDDWGVVFKLDTAGNETILHSFGSGSDGRAPLGRLILDPSGHIWGVTQQGGLAGWGTAFEIVP